MPRFRECPFAAVGRPFPLTPFRLAGWLLALRKVQSSICRRRKGRASMFFTLTEENAHQMPNCSTESSREA